jgi:hypothetical protein
LPGLPGEGRRLGMRTMFLVYVVVITAGIAAFVIVGLTQP